MLSRKLCKDISGKTKVIESLKFQSCKLPWSHVFPVPVLLYHSLRVAAYSLLSYGYTLCVLAGKRVPGFGKGCFAILVTTFECYREAHWGGELRSYSVRNMVAHESDPYNPLRITIIEEEYV